jgi:hypothetical protein
MKNLLPFILAIISVLQSFGQATFDSVSTEQKPPHLYTLNKPEDLNIKVKSMQLTIIKDIREPQQEL